MPRNKKPASPAPGPSTLERVNALLREIDEARKQEGLSESQKDDLRARELQALRTKSRIESDAAGFKDVLIKNLPDFQEFVRCISESISECDRCSDALDRALQKLKV